MKLRSDSFKDNQPIPAHYAFCVPDPATHVALGDNHNPHLAWEGAPAGTKSFVLIYNLKDNDRLFQRFPGVEGTFYYVAGVGVNYQRSDDITLAPIRTGVGLRAGANIGYLHYTRKHSWLPL